MNENTYMVKRHGTLKQVVKSIWSDLHAPFQSQNLEANSSCFNIENFVILFSQKN